MTNNDKIKLSQNIAIIAGIFSITVALLLLLNFLQVSKNDPIESKVLEALVERLSDEPNNEALKIEIRNFDLLARKAYFNSRWQIKTGAYLLLFGAIVLAFALHFYYTAKNKIGQPDTVHENEIIGRILAQKGIIIVGAVVFALALVASFATVNHLNHYDVKVEAKAGITPADEKIEVIEVQEIVQQEEQDSVKTEVAETVVAPVIESKKEEVKKAKKPVAKPIQKTSAGLTLTDIKKNHNSFRGPLAQGVDFHKNIPIKWDGSAGKNILWKSPIPKKGYNSPIIWGDKIFVSGGDKSGREVYCFNRNTGKLLWMGKADNIKGTPAKLPKVTEDTGLAAPTLTTDGKRVFAIFATGDVIAFDMNGKPVWARNLGVPDNHYGHSSSLITWANKLFVQYDTNKGGKVLALDVATGKTVWETVRKSKISWASPVLAEVDGKYQLLLSADPIVAGYDIETGEELWQTECMMGEVGPSVGYADGVAFAANEYAVLAAININDGSVIWENDEYLPEAASPLAYNGLLFVATSYGVLVCYDAKTGEQYWEHDVGTTLYSSPMFADGKLFIMDNDGVMRIYEYAKEMKLISENELGEMAGTTPAFADNRIYIRGEKNLYCIGK
jgi:outer membrane protein assembly factor BamB